MADEIALDLEELQEDSYLDNDGNDSILGEKQELWTPESKVVEAFPVNAPKTVTQGNALRQAQSTRPKVVPFPDIIKKGSKGKDVLAVKRALAEAGFPSSKTKLFGEGAVEALKGFQKKHQLRADGIYGRASHKKLAPFYDAWGVHLIMVAEKAEAATGPEFIRKRLVAVAFFTYNREPYIHYTQGSLRMSGCKGRLEPPNYGRWEDCSSETTWYYGVATNWKIDPNGLGFNGYGYTGTQIVHGKRISVNSAKAGDLVFYGSSGISHVAIDVGNGRVISHGSESGPALRSKWYRSDAQFAVNYLTYN